MKPEEGIKSPFVEKPVFDLDEYRDETTMRAVAAIFKIFGKYGDDLAYRNTATLQSIAEIENKVTQEMMEALVDNNVPDKDVQHLMDVFLVVLQRLFENISRIKREYEKELLAYALNARNPADGHIAREWATISDLFTALEKARIAHKDDPKGYFYVTKEVESDTIEKSNNQSNTSTTMYNTNTTEEVVETPTIETSVSTEESAEVATEETIETPTVE